jgi:hypothetical protein
MSEQTSTKPEVQYQGTLYIKEWPWIADDEPKIYVAVLPLVLNHPHLGECEQVRTSPIVKWPDEQGNFETKNTRYVRVYPKSMSEIGLSGTN